MERDLSFTPEKDFNWKTVTDLDGVEMDIRQIMATIQHRFPFLLVDRMLELEPGKHAVGLKNVTADEYFFPGQYPKNSMMPGALLVEHGAQVGCIFLLAMEANKGKLALFAGVDGVKFRRKVIPGDQLITEVIVLRLSGRAGKATVISRVDGKVVAEGQYTFMFIPDPVQQEQVGKG